MTDLEKIAELLELRFGCFTETAELVARQILAILTEDSQ